MRWPEEDAGIGLEHERRHLPDAQLLTDNATQMGPRHVRSGERGVRHVAGRVRRLGTERREVDLGARMSRVTSTPVIVTSSSRGSESRSSSSASTSSNDSFSRRCVGTCGATSRRVQLLRLDVEELHVGRRGDEALDRVEHLLQVRGRPSTSATPIAARCHVSW